MKSKCFMLVVCFALLMGVTSCSNDDFETSAPDEQKKLSNAELIEMALSRMPNRTRGIAPFPVAMVTTNKTVTISCWAAEDIVINWSDGAQSSVPRYSFSNYSHTYTDNEPSHGIFLECSDQAIEQLSINNDGLIYLDVTNNTKLETLSCDWNKLEILDLTGCHSLTSVSVIRNNLSSIDVTHAPNLLDLALNYNQFTNIDVSKNPNLNLLWVGNNHITDLDLTKNKVLRHLLLDNLSIKTINNLPISSTSFAAFPLLQEISISYTPFTSLDISSNPFMFGIIINGTTITQLDISNLRIRYLYAINSNLTNLIYTPNNLVNTNDLRINNTPFEKLSTNMYPLITNALPKRSLEDQGHLYTNSSALIAPFLSLLTAKNWVVNQ